MLTNVLLDTISLEQGGATRYHVIIAVLTLAGLLAWNLILRYRDQSIGLPEQFRQHKEAYLGQLEAQSPGDLKLPIDVDFESRRPEIRACWSDDPPSQDHTTVRDSLGAVHRSLVESWRGAIGHVPLLSVRLAEEGIAILMFGTLAVVSADTWEYWASFRSGKPDPQAVTDTLLTATYSALDSGAAIAAAFPYGGFVWGMTFGYAVMAIEWLYYHWFVVAAVLLVGSAIIAALDRRVDGANRPIYKDRLGTVSKIVGSVILVWVAGVVPTVVGDAANASDAGALAGFLLAVVTALYLIVRAVKRFIGRVRTVGVRASLDTDADDRMVSRYLLARRLFAVVGVVALALLPLYLGVIILHGRLWTLLDVLAGASTDVKVLVALATVAVLAVLAYEVRDAWPDIRAGVGHTIASKSVRLALFGRAMPFGICIASYIAIMGFGFSPLIAFVAALLAGAVGRLMYLAFLRAKYHADMWERSDPTPNRVLIEAYELEDSDGEAHYVAAINRERIARDNLDDLVDELVAQADHIAGEGTHKPSLGRKYAKWMFEYGLSDEEQAEKKLRKKVEKKVYTPLKRNNGQVETETVDQKLADFPRDFVEDRLRDFRLEGTKDGRVFERGDYYELAR